MKRSAAVLALTAALAAAIITAAPASAQTGPACGGNAGANLVPFAKETITVSSTALPLTTATYTPADGLGGAWMAFITVDTNNVSVWLDGSTPTASDGHVVATGGALAICSPSLPLFRAIRITNDAKLRVTYYRPRP